MKMKTLNISLTPDMYEYVQANIGSMYGNVSEFFRDLIRDRIEGQSNEEFALTEYGATPEQADKAIAKALAEIAEDEKHGRAVVFKGKIPRC